MALRRTAEAVRRLSGAARRSLAPPARRYCIAARYGHRVSACDFDDTANRDEWQPEVYRYARGIALDRGVRRVCDVGCGSGFKLVEYLGEFETIGFDVPVTVDFLRQKYPERRWQVADLTTEPSLTSDLVICADVIEHVPDPDLLVRFIKRMQPWLVVFSTPARELLYRSGGLRLRHHLNSLGPPLNRAHVREWSFAEFGEYIARDFVPLTHFVSDPEHGTQLMLAAPRRAERLE